jgi:hypothetical protein
MMETQPFSRTFFFFHGGILAITKPFSWTFHFFHDGILAIMKPFSRTFFFFHDGILAITKPFSRTFLIFHDGILEIRNLGEDSFYTYITKSIYIGSASLKTLPLDLEPPLQGKEYGPPYSKATMKVKTILHLGRTCFFLKSLIDTWFRFFNFWNANLRKWKKYSIRYI